MPATIEDVERIISGFADVTESDRMGARTWFVGKKAFAWERGYSKADLKRFAAAGETPPDGPLVAITTDGLHDKEALLAEGRPGVFTIEHFNNYPLVLLQLKRVGKRDLKQLLTEAHAAVGGR